MYLCSILKSSEDKLKSDHEEQNNIMTQRNLEIHPCCIPGCINNADYLNESTNAKPESIAIFTPPSIVSFILIIYQHFKSIIFYSKFLYYLLLYY